MINYGFIGTGTIGKMLIERFQDKDIALYKHIHSSNSSRTNSEVIDNGNIIYLCVRPQNLQSVYSDLRGNLEGKVLVSSIVAVESDAYYRNLGKIELIRIIPSITNRVGGTILFNSGEFVKSGNRAQVHSDLSRIANVYEVSEEYLDEYTHLASCSPAIISEFIRQYLNSMILRGINERRGEEILLDALHSTATLLRKDSFDVIDQVCTKQGISRIGVNYVAQKFPVQELSDDLISRMKSVKKNMVDKMIEQLIKKFGTPLYVYEEEKISENYRLINDSIPYQNKEIHYAVMCNSNSEILKIIRKLGGFVQINSLHELNLVKEAEFKNGQISFTSTGLDTNSLEKLIHERVQINLDSVEEVEKYCRLNPNKSFGIRVKMREGIKLPEGHTNSPKDSDIGICEEDINRVKKIAKQSGCRINGIHGYLASNILVSEPFLQSSDYLVECAKQFSDLDYVNFGSGFGVPNRPEEQRFDFEGIGQHYSKLTQELSNYFGKNIQLKIEPGRSIIATAGTLYAKVNNVKQLKGKKQIAINAGFAEFSRPRIYGAYHEIEVVGKNRETELYDIRGNTVLQSDFLGRNRQLTKVVEEDILAIKNTGAYGIVMASGFPGKVLPKEVLIYRDGEIRGLRGRYS